MGMRSSFGERTSERRSTEVKVSGETVEGRISAARETENISKLRKESFPPSLSIDGSVLTEGQKFREKIADQNGKVTEGENDFRLEVGNDTVEGTCDSNICSGEKKSDRVCDDRDEETETCGGNEGTILPRYCYGYGMVREVTNRISAGKLTEVINNSIKEAVQEIAKQYKVVPNEPQDRRNGNVGKGSPYLMDASDGSVNIGRTREESRMRNEPGSNDQEKQSRLRSPKRKTNSNPSRASSPKKIESPTRPRSKKIRAKAANGTEDDYPKLNGKVHPSSVRTDNRRMTGNVNIYICSEATENIQAKPGKEKSVSELSARSDSTTSNKLLNKIRRKRKESRDDSLDYIPEKEETDSSNSEDTNIRSSESEAKGLKKLDTDPNKYLECPCPRLSNLSSDSSSLIVYGSENSRNRRTICPLNLRTNSVDSGDWTTKPVCRDVNDKSYWKIGEPCPMRGRGDESSEEWLPNSICPDIYERNDTDIECVCQERETSVCGTRSDSGDDWSLVCHNCSKAASDTEDSCSLHSVCGDSAAVEFSGSVKTDRKSRFGRKLSVCSCIMEEEREAEENGTSEMEDSAIPSTNFEKHEALDSTVNLTGDPQKRDSLRDEIKEEDILAVRKEEDSATTKDDSTEKAEDRPRTSSSSRRRSTETGKLDSYAENKMEIVENKEQEAEKDNMEIEDFSKSPPDDLVAKQEPPENETRLSLNLPKRESSSTQPTEPPDANDRKKSETLNDKNHTNDKNRKRRSSEIRKSNAHSENKMEIIENKEQEAKENNLGNGDFPKNPTDDFAAKEEPPKNKTRPSLNLPKPQLNVENPQEAGNSKPTEPPNANGRKKSRTLNDNNHTNDKNRKRRSSEIRKSNAHAENKMEIIENKQQEARKSNLANGDFPKNPTDDFAAKEEPPKNKTRPSLNLPKPQFIVENPPEAANSKSTDPPNANSRRKSKTLNNNNPIENSNFEKEIKLLQPALNVPRNKSEDQSDKQNVEESEKSVENSSEKEVSKTEPRKTFRERIKDSFCYRGVKRMIDAIKRRRGKSAEASKIDEGESEPAEEERLPDDKLNLESSIATIKRPDDKLTLENGIGPTRDPAESGVAPRLPEDMAYERNASKAMTVTDRPASRDDKTQENEGKEDENLIESKVTEVEGTKDDADIYGASQGERPRPKLLKVLARRGVFLSRTRGPSRTGTIDRISAELGLDEVKHGDSPGSVEFLNEEEPRKSRKESEESKGRVESETPSPDTSVTDRAQEQEELEATEERSKDVEEVRTSLQEQRESRVQEQPEKEDKDVELEKKESDEVRTVKRGSFGEDIHAARASLKPGRVSIERGSKIDDEIRGSRVSELRNGLGTHPKSSPARYEARVRLCPIHSDRYRNRCQCNCNCGKSARRSNEPCDARSSRNREKVHLNKDQARRGSGGRSLFCLYCDNPGDRCLCRGPIEKCTGCGLSRDLCGCRPDLGSFSGRPVPCQDNDRCIRVTAWTPRREVRRYFARDPERARPGQVRATPRNSSNSRCREKLKPHGSDDLPYQRLSAFSNVMDELQRKISCTRCKKVPCRCLGPKIQRDLTIQEEAKPKRRLDRAAKVTASPERSRGKRRYEQPMTTDRGIAPAIHVCCACKTTPCRCKASNGQRKGPRAKCYYCKSLPCVCITPGEQSKSRPCRCTDSQCRAGEKVIQTGQLEPSNNGIIDSSSPV